MVARAHVKFVSPRERLVHLKTVPMLRDLPPSALLGLAQAVRERHFAEGDRLIEPGGPVHCGYVLVEGRVELRWADRPVRSIEPPDNVGFLGTLARVEGRVEATAQVPVLALEIGGDELHAAYAASFELTLGTMGALAREILDLRGGLPFDPESPPSAEVGPPIDEKPDYVERMLSWHRSALFRDANLDAISQFVRQERFVRYEPGDVIWRRGDPSEFSLEVLHGIVTCDPGDDRPPIDVGYDYNFGLDVIAGRERSVDLIAKTPVAAQILESEAWMTVLEDQPDLMVAYLTSMARFAIYVRAQTLEGSPELDFTTTTAAEPRE